MHASALITYMNANNLSILCIVLLLISFITKDEEVEPDAEEAGDDENADDEGKRLLNGLVQSDGNAPHHPLSVLPVTVLDVTRGIVFRSMNTSTPSRSTTIRTVSHNHCYDNVCQVQQSATSMPRKSKEKNSSQGGEQKKR